MKSNTTSILPAFVISLALIGCSVDEPEDVTRSHEVPAIPAVEEPKEEHQPSQPLPATTETSNESAEQSTPPPAQVEPEETGAPAPAVAPFDAEQAEAHQQAWAKHLGVEVEITNSIGMKLTLIPPGEFKMGSTQEEVDEQLKTASEWSRGRISSELHQHPVTLTRPLYLGTHEVTRGQFRKFVEDTNYRTDAERNGKGGWAFGHGKDGPHPSHVWNGDFGFEQTDDHPVILVSWNDVNVFCGWLSAKEGVQYVLPTEAQWEFAFRAGSEAARFMADNPDELGDYGWHHQRRTNPIGQKKPNPFSLHGMYGNAGEWVQDWHAPYEARGVTDPAGPAGGNQRAVRGNFSTHYLAARDYRAPDSSEWNRGFRVARVIPDANATTSEGPVAEVGDWIDLLALVDVKKDALDGKWRKTDEQLSIEGAEGARVILPMAIKGNYELEVEFTRQAGVDDVNIILPVGEYTAMVNLSADGGRVSGLSLIDEKGPRENPTGQPSALKNRQRHTLTCRVQVNGNFATVNTELDGERHLQWSGSASSLSLPGIWLVDRYAGGIGAKSPVTFHSIRLRMKDGEATPLSAFPARLVATLQSPQKGQARAAAISPDGRFFAATHYNYLHLWNLSERKLVRSQKVYHYLHTSINFLPDNQQMLTAGYDYLVRRWDITSGRQLSAATGKHHVMDVAMSPIGNEIAIACGSSAGSGGKTGWIRVIDLKSMRLKKQLDGPNVRHQAIAYSPSGGTIAGGTFDGKIHLWNSDSLQLVKTLNASGAEVLVFSKDGSALAAGGKGIELWHSTTWERTRKLDAGPVHDMRYVPNTDVIVATSWGGKISFWDAKQGEKIGSLPGNVHGGGAALDVTSDGKTLVISTSDGVVKIWDLRLPEEFWHTPEEQRRILLTRIKNLGGLVGEDQDGEVEQILRGESRVGLFSNVDLALLKKMPQLKQIDFSESSITDDGMEHMEELTNLTNLTLDSTQVTDAGLRTLEGLTKLEGLGLSNLRITDAGFVHVSGMPKLKVLAADSTPITDAGLRHVRELSDLTSLSIANTRITDAGMEHVAGLNNLTHLHLDNLPITDAGMKHLAGLTNLEHIGLSGTNISDSGLEHLRKASGLKDLSLAKTRVTDAGLEHLAGLMNLESLLLHDSPIGDDGLVHLVDLPSLRQLGLNGTRITGAGLKHLESAKNLETLHLSNTRVSNAGVKELQEALPDCQVVRTESKPSVRVPRR